MTALAEVVERLEQFRRGGALRHEGGERALRGFLVTGFFMRALGWPWQRLVLGESLDLLAVDWRDQPVFYVERNRPIRRWSPATARRSPAGSIAGAASGLPC